MYVTSIIYISVENCHIAVDLFPLYMSVHITKVIDCRIYSVMSDIINIWIMSPCQCNGKAHSYIQAAHLVRVSYVYHAIKRQVLI